jgi:hypothetical protein
MWKKLSESALKSMTAQAAVFSAPLWGNNKKEGE